MYACIVYNNHWIGILSIKCQQDREDTLKKEIKKYFPDSVFLGDIDILYSISGHNWYS